MSHDKLRRQILYSAARLLSTGQAANCTQAKWTAARKLCRGWIPQADLPQDWEIREEVLRISGTRNPTSPAALVPDDEPEVCELHESAERFAVYRALLLPLEKVVQHRRRHPEGDALYHCLQVFSLAQDELPYDEEFQLAALLHDVGKGIDPYDHIASGLAALGNSISERTAWLIEHHHEAQSLLDGKIGSRARRRLAGYENYEELLLLARCDRAGRVPGAVVPELDEALASIRELSDNLG